MQTTLYVARYGMQLSELIGAAVSKAQACQMALQKVMPELEKVLQDEETDLQNIKTTIGQYQAGQHEEAYQSFRQNNFDLIVTPILVEDVPAQLWNNDKRERTYSAHTEYSGGETQDVYLSVRLRYQEDAEIDHNQIQNAVAEAISEYQSEYGVGTDPSKDLPEDEDLLDVTIQHL